MYVCMYVCIYIYIYIEARSWTQLSQSWTQLEAILLPKIAEPGS